MRKTLGEQLASPQRYNVILATTVISQKIPITFICYSRFIQFKLKNMSTKDRLFHRLRMSILGNKRSVSARKISFKEW